MSTADGVICASERQRDLWMGFLMAIGRLDAEQYRRDPSLRALIDVVPFGLPFEPPTAETLLLRERLGISSEACVLLWAGGMWDWFDPLILVEAIASSARLQERASLVFMGAQPPGAGFSATNVNKIRQRAAELGLLGASVHFLDEWVPYHERAAYLLDANIGVSTHGDTAEARYSYRTRMLDYVWAGLPVVCSEGDSWADLLTGSGAGFAVPPGDLEALTGMLTHLVASRDLLEHATAASRSLAAASTWDRAVEPLAAMIRRLTTETLTPARRGAVVSYARHWSTMTISELRGAGGLAVAARAGRVLAAWRDAPRR